MPLVDKLLTVAIKYLQKKQKSLRKGAKKRKNARRKEKPKKPKRPPKRKIAQKPSAKKTLKKHQPLLLEKKPRSKPLPEKIAGVVTHYFARIEVVVIDLKKAGIKVGDTIHIKGRATDFTQKVRSLQIESVNRKSVV